MSDQQDKKTGPTATAVKSGIKNASALKEPSSPHKRAGGKALASETVASTAKKIVKSRASEHPDKTESMRKSEAGLRRAGKKEPVLMPKGGAPAKPLYHGSRVPEQKSRGFTVFAMVVIVVIVIGILAKAFHWF